MAFAASCVEVLVPSYVRYSELEQVGDPALVRAVTDAVWSALVSDQPEEGLSALPSAGAVRELLPSEEGWNEWAPQAEDAIASLGYLLELVRNDDVTVAAYPAERAYAAVDELTAREQDLGVLDADGREALLESPPIQVELQRQAEALRGPAGLGLGTFSREGLRAAAERTPVGGVTGFERS
ncbi:DUF416 family protein [Micromonospora sp. NPDC049366]|uniref:DUF416 family protein n=1 Tax=Micromonospora sp. NPDC049366 TaxID=3364271 RepID=UPI003796DDA3